MFYDKIKKGVVFTPNENTVGWNDASLDLYREMSANLSDKSYEVTYDVTGMPIVTRLKLDDNGERYTKYLDTVVDGFKQPDLVAIKEDELNISKQNKIQQIKNDCTANNPITLDVNFIDSTTKSITFNGGDSSASAISGAITLAQQLGEIEVKLWDYKNVIHSGISFNEALVISAFIAQKWRDDMFKRQELITQINNATTIEEVEAIAWI